MTTYRIAPADATHDYLYIIQRLKTKTFLWWSWRTWDTLCGLHPGDPFPLYFSSVEKARDHLTRNRHLSPGDTVWETIITEVPLLS